MLQRFITHAMCYNRGQQDVRVNEYFHETRRKTSFSV
jgi:hypothetical protein